MASLICVLWRVIDFLQTYNGAVTAVATVFIGVFTCVLTKVTGRQARLTRESIDLARKEFISAHPPKLSIRYVHPTSKEENIEVGFTVENTGGSDATVTQSMIGLFIYKAPLPCPPEFHKFGRDILSGIKFGAGGTQFFTVSNDLEKSPIANLGDDQYFIGWAEYVDASGSIAPSVSVANFSSKPIALSLLTTPSMNQTTAAKSRREPAGCELAALTFTRTRARSAE